MEENRNHEFVTMYRQHLDELSETIPRSQRHLELALCHLLNRFAAEIPPVQCDRFHKTFRQSDVIDPDAPAGTGGALDMVFWNLLACDCKVFWKLQQKFCEQLKTESPDQESLMSESTSNSSGTCTFSFRVWLQPEGGDPPEIEVWYPGLESTIIGQSSYTQWCKDALQERDDWHETFNLDPEKHWQIVGKADLTGWVDQNDEFEEELTFHDDSIEKAEVPENWAEIREYPGSFLVFDENPEVVE